MSEPVLKDDASTAAAQRQASLALAPGQRATSWRATLWGWYTLFLKEILRFWRVALQTIAAPVLSTVLYLLIFNHVLDGRADVYGGMAYARFLIPGLAMMAILNNAFANSSSSLIQSKITGSLTFLLLTPLSHRAWFAAYIASSILRALVVGACVLLVTPFFTELQLPHPFWALAFALIGAGLLGTLGLIAGLWADKFDQLAAFQNFLIMPMTFLSGVFYSIHSLPALWQQISHLNPFFYLIDGFRYGFLGQGDFSPWLSLGITLAVWAATAALALGMLRNGYKIRG